MASGKCPASGRQFGNVRKGNFGHGWSARFQFNQQGTRFTVDGPVRTRRADAETDRDFIAAAMGQVPRSSRSGAAKHAIQFLRGGEDELNFKVPGEDKKKVAPGSASMLELNPMSASMLRTLAVRTPGIVRDKKTDRRRKIIKWIPKTSKELKKDIMALPGRPTSKKRPARA